MSAMDGITPGVHYSGFFPCLLCSMASAGADAFKNP